MSGDYIGLRDFEVLSFIARYGIVSRESVSVWAGTASTATLGRERRLRDFGLVEVHPGPWGKGRVLVCTLAGLSAVGLRRLGPPRLRLATVGHELEVSVLAARIESSGGVTLSEREIDEVEGVAGGCVYSARVVEDARHLPDLVYSLDGGRRWRAVEVELSPKGAKRLDRILRGWSRSVEEGCVSGVTYRCEGTVRSAVERAIERTDAARAVAVKAL